jgi:hypothetical protein
MNAVFADKIGKQEGYDSKGRPIQVALAPGALPRTADAPVPQQIVSVPQPAPTVASEPVLASVATPPRAGLLGVLGASQPKAQAVAVAAAPSSEPVVLRGTNTPAKPKPAAQPSQVVQAQPKAATPEAPMQRTASAARPDVASDAARNEAPQLRTAFSAPPVASGSVLPGATPVVPTGSFESRWSGAAFR